MTQDLDTEINAGDDAFDHFLDAIIVKHVDKDSLDGIYEEKN